MDYEKQIYNDADEIINGKGYVVIPNLFSKEEIKEAKDLIDQNMEKLLKEAGRDSAVQGQYLPGFVKPMEDWEKGSKFPGGEDIKNNFSVDLKKLLFGYDYPRVMQEAD